MPLKLPECLEGEAVGKRLLKTAGLKPEWETAFWAATLALNTTMRGCELKGLLWADVNLMDGTLCILKSKTEAGERVIPHTPEAFDVLLKLRKRAEMFGPVDANHFVFGSFRPKFRLQNKPGKRGGIAAGMEMADFDPTRPLGSRRTAWRTLRVVAAKEDKEKGIPEMPRWASFRFHDLRHHAITGLAESGASEQANMSIAGHISHKMLERYSHVRLEAKRQAIQALSHRPGETIIRQTSLGGHGTNDGTKPVMEVSGSPEVPESNGRPERTRTVDLYRVKVAL
jgi:integrase